MDTYSRHVFRQVTSSLLLILISLTMIVWMATALKEIKLVTTQGQSFLLFLQMTTLALPSLMGFVAPIAFLIGCLHVLNRVDGDSELIVMNAGGANIWRIARPYMLMAFIVSGALLASNLYVQPLSLRTLKAFVIQVRTDLISQVLQPGKFSSLESGKLTFHIRERSLDGGLLGLAIHDNRDKKQVMTYLAETGHILKRGKEAYLVMTNGHIQRKAEKKGAAEIIAFQQYVFNLTQFGPGTSNRKITYKASERYLHELLNPTNSRYDKRNIKKIKSEVHKRFTSPLYPFAFAMIAVAMIGRVKSTRQKSMNGVFLAFGVAILVKVTGVAIENAVTKQPHLSALLYAVPIGAFLIAAFVAANGMSYRKNKA